MMQFVSEPFTEAAISDETRRFNTDLSARLGALPDQWSFPPAVIRERRAQGLGPFPIPPKSPDAETIVTEGPHGGVPLRIIRPPAGTTRGAFLHIHGGGWVLGAADQQDVRLLQIAERTGLVAISVDYRLAPEHPYPQGPDDCEAAALWLVGEGARRLGVDRFAIGGDSAGGNLTATTLIRLRDRHGLTPFSAAVFIAGMFDLRLTPSARRWGSEKLVLNTRDVEMFVRHYLARGQDPADPDISPLLADLSGLPSAHFSVGTHDPLTDDSLFMAARWLAAGNPAELAVYPGGCHVFHNYPLAIADAANAAIDRFLIDHAANRGAP